MSFAVPADSYDRFIGRYSRPLAAEFAEFAGVERGLRALDVGCGPGALTTELVQRLGAAAVAAVDPSAGFVGAARERNPGIEVGIAAAEDLPFDDGAFDVSLAQLVVHFMADPVAGLREMGRVTRAGGVIAACVWDHAGGTGPLATFWQAVRELTPGAPDEAGLAGAREGHLVELFTAAGLRDVVGGSVAVAVEYASFDEWWEPFTLRVGPAGAHVAGLDEAARADLRARCRALLPDGPFIVRARAWAARGRH